LSFVVGITGKVFAATAETNIILKPTGVRIHVIVATGFL
jgi:hypothetical protein